MRGLLITTIPATGPSDADTVYILRRNNNEAQLGNVIQTQFETDIYCQAWSFITIFFFGKICLAIQTLTLGLPLPSP